MRDVLPLFGSATLLALAGCAHSRPSLAVLPAREYRGHYTSGAGASWFRPCGAARVKRHRERVDAHI